MQGEPFVVPISGEGLKAGSTVTYTLKIKNGNEEVTALTQSNTTVVNAAPSYLVPESALVSTPAFSCSLQPGSYSAEVEITDTTEAPLLDQCNNTLPTTFSRTQTVRTFDLIKSGDQVVSVGTMLLDGNNNTINCFKTTSVTNKKGTTVQTSPGGYPRSLLIRSRRAF